MAREFGQFPAPGNSAKLFSSLIHLPYQNIRVSFLYTSRKSRSPKEPEICDIVGNFWENH